jgi:hypothetical protein
MTSSRLIEWARRLIERPVFETALIERRNRGRQSSKAVHEPGLPCFVEMADGRTFFGRADECVAHRGDEALTMIGETDK